MKTIFTILFSFACTLVYAGVVHAVELQVDYPAVAGEEFEGGGPLAWIRYIYFGAFAVIGIVAFASLVYAGIKWMTSRSEGGVSDAKDRIQKALLGLLLAGASFLILNLINPDLVDLREPRIQLPQAPERSDGPAPGSPDGREDPVNQLLPEEPGMECTQATGGCGLWRESIPLTCKQCREANGSLSPTRMTCVAPGATNGACPASTTGTLGTVTLNGQCSQSVSAPASQKCNDSLGLTCDSSNTCRKKDGLSCVISLECKTGSQCLGLKCTGTSSGPTGSLSVEIHPNPSAPSVDTPILHVVTISGGVPNTSYGVSVNDGDGRTKGAALKVDANGFGRLFNEIILNYREEGTYTVTTTITHSGKVVSTSSYPIQVGGGSAPPPNQPPTTPPAGMSIEGPTEFTSDAAKNVSYTFFAQVAPQEVVQILWTISAGTLSASNQVFATADASGIAKAAGNLSVPKKCDQIESRSGVNVHFYIIRNGVSSPIYYETPSPTYITPAC